MSNASMLATLERTSKISTILMVLGALVVASALWLATNRLAEVQTEVAALESRSESIRSRNTALEIRNKELVTTAEALRKETSGLRQALSASRDAIAAFHQRDYASAVNLYDTALAADPGNAYLLNLKAYSLFKLKDIDKAIAVQQEGIRVDPTYAWGFFDLARFQCASGNKSAAAVSFAEAVRKDARLQRKAAQDGEFQRLCGSLPH